MNRRTLREAVTDIKVLNNWLFLLAILVGTLVCIFALRTNNVTALRLRDDVLRADKENGDVEAALRTLREYTYAHMNTDLSSGSIAQPIQLKYRYERLVQAEKDRVSKQNEKIYTTAQAECEKLFPKGLSGSGRIPCITDYVAKNGEKERSIPDSLYKFSFVSPRWSPDLAGWSLVVTSVLVALFVVKLLVERWLRAELHDL